MNVDRFTHLNTQLNKVFKKRCGYCVLSLHEESTRAEIDEAISGLNGDEIILSQLRYVLTTAKLRSEYNEFTKCLLHSPCNETKKTGSGGAEPKFSKQRSAAEKPKRLVEQKASCTHSNWFRNRRGTREMTAQQNYSEWVLTQVQHTLSSSDEEKEEDNSVGKQQRQSGSITNWLKKPIPKEPDQKAQTSSSTGTKRDWLLDSSSGEEGSALAIDGEEEGSTERGSNEEEPTTMEAMQKQLDVYRKLLVERGLRDVPPAIRPVPARKREVQPLVMRVRISSPTRGALHYRESVIHGHESVAENARARAWLCREKKRQKAIKRANKAMEKAMWFADDHSEAKKAASAAHKAAKAAEKARGYIEAEKWAGIAEEKAAEAALAAGQTLTDDSDSS